MLWKSAGWNVLQEVDAEKHVTGVDCRTEKGEVVEVRLRHHDGEERIVKAVMNGENVLPMDAKEFEKLFAKGEIELK